MGFKLWISRGLLSLKIALSDYSQSSALLDIIYSFIF